MCGWFVRARARVRVCVCVCVCFRLFVCFRIYTILIRRVLYSPVLLCTLLYLMLAGSSGGER
ncbi:hypothetical protein T492DRAFT_974339 [Pavlovales sp. CCMP2436]|nr:hypothetical protein T492DRAFT_974339 [Pavlovales sp. CCMP2436]